MEADGREGSESFSEEKEGKIVCSKTTLKLRNEKKNVSNPNPESLAETSWKHLDIYVPSHLDALSGLQKLHTWKRAAYKAVLEAIHFGSVEPAAKICL